MNTVLLKRCITPGTFLMVAISLVSCGSNSSTPSNGRGLTVDVLSATDSIRSATVCLDINDNLRCDSNETQAESDSSGRVTLDVNSVNNEKTNYLLAEVAIGKASTAKDGTARARYTLLAEAPKNNASLVISPLSSYVALHARASGVEQESVISDVARRLGLKANTEPSLLLSNYLGTSTNYGSELSTIRGQASNIENAFKRIGLSRLDIVDGVVNEVTQAMTNGQDAEKYAVYPLGNPDDGNLLTYTVGENGRADLNSIRLQCLSQPHRHAGVDIRTVQSDPLHQYQWHITGVRRWIDNLVEDEINPGSDINAGDTYLAGYTGACVRVAVIDTPVSLEHPDLITNTIPLGSVSTRPTLGLSNNELTDAVEFEPRPEKWSRESVVAHGTSVAGIIASSAGNNEGGRGVAPGALIRSFSSPESGADSTMQPGGETENTGEDIQAPQPVENPSEFADNQERDILIQETRALGDALFTSKYPQLSAVDVLNFSGSLHGEPARIGRNMPVVIREALRAGTSNLRDGLGALYVVSSGNGYEPSNEACHKYGIATQDGEQVLMPCQITAVMDQQSSPYTISVGAHNAEGKVTSYSTPGTSLWITGPSSDREGSRDAPTRSWPGIIATDLEGCDLGFSTNTSDEASGQRFEQGLSADNSHCNYTSAFGGTSASAPIVSGAIALLLEKHPQLNWRQVKYSLAKSAKQLQPETSPVHLDVNGEQYEAISGWVINGAGFPYHYRYGFGGIDVDRAVAVADGIFAGTDAFGAQLGQAAFNETDWVPATIDPEFNQVPDFSNEGLTSQLSLPTSSNQVIEAVQLSLNLTGARLSDLSVELTSPSGTKSILWSARNEMRLSSYEALPAYAEQSQPSIELTAPDRNGQNIYLGDFREPTKPEFSAATWYSTDGSKKIQGFVLLSNQFYGEQSVGTWTLRVVDTANGTQAYGEVEFDPETFQPQTDDQGNYVYREVTVENPSERILEGWAVKIFGHDATNQ